jgi:hypothetical protein
MKRLEVSAAVRPLKWPLGVKWLTSAPITLPSGNEPVKCVTDKSLSHELSARKIIPLQAGN